MHPLPQIDGCSCTHRTRTIKGPARSYPKQAQQLKIQSRKCKQNQRGEIKQKGTKNERIKKQITLFIRGLVRKLKASVLRFYTLHKHYFCQLYSQYVQKKYVYRGTYSTHTNEAPVYQNKLTGLLVGASPRDSVKDVFNN